MLIRMPVGFRESLVGFRVQGFYVGFRAQGFYSDVGFRVQGFDSDACWV